MRIPVGVFLAEWEKDSLPSLMDFQGLYQCPHPISDCLTCLTQPIHFLESNLEGDVSVLVPKLEKLFMDENLKSGERQQHNFYEKFQNDFAQLQKFTTDHSKTQLISEIFNTCRTYS